jgi:hypothetical protein
VTTKAEILRSIRRKCLDCSGHQPSEVRDCKITGCDLWPYRLGRDPEPSRNRGFAKSLVYTEDLSRDGLGRYPPGRLSQPGQKSPGYAGDFGEGGASPAAPASGEA